MWSGSLYMTTQVEALGGNRLDLVKWVVAIVLLVAATLLGNRFLTDISSVLRIGGTALLVLLAFGIALSTTKGRGFLVGVREARVEARKVVWPTRQETWQTTLIVAAVVVLASLLLWGIDSLFGWIVSSIIG
jgi:preprotein translocase subunit SecE